MVTELIAMPSDAFLTEPEKKAKAKKRKKTDAGSDFTWDSDL